MRTQTLSLLWMAACSGGTGTFEIPDEPSDPTGSVTGSQPTSPENCPVLTGFSEVQGVPVLERHFTVTLDAPGQVWLACTSDTIPEEIHLLESSEAATSHELVLHGILADHAYTCEAHAACGGEPLAVAFQTGIPEELPQFEVLSNPEFEMSGAYTLFNTQAGCGNEIVWLVIVDPDGRVRWTYPVGGNLLSDVDAYLIDPQTLHMGGGWGLFDQGSPNRGVFRTIDLSGQVLIERTEPDFGLGFNHHSEPLSDGSYLTITGEIDTDGQDSWNGVGVEHWHPEQGLLWTWGSQPLVDAGLLEDSFDFLGLPYHANAVSFHTDALGDALWMSNFGEEELWRIDRATGERTHRFGHGGDFILIDASGVALPDAEFPYVQHGPDYQEDRVLVYDNGTGRPGGSYSRVAEYQLDLVNLQATLLWSWTEPGWNNPILGDADYLPGGNVLVTQGFNSCLDPFGNDVSELVELSPPSGQVWRLKWPSRTHTTYRAERYQGCDVFANARYCPDVATRLAELTGS
jgi:hypothetical protein